MIKFAPNKTILKIVSYHNQMDYGLLYLACFMKILRWSKYRCDAYVKSFLRVYWSNNWVNRNKQIYFEKKNNFNFPNLQLVQF